MKNWHFNVLFFVGVGSAVLLLIGPETWVNRNPTAVTGVGSILAFILTQKKTLTKQDDKKKDNSTKEDEEVS